MEIIMHTASSWIDHTSCQAPRRANEVNGANNTYNSFWFKITQLESKQKWQWFRNKFHSKQGKKTQEKCHIEKCDNTRKRNPTKPQSLDDFLSQTEWKIEKYFQQIRTFSHDSHKADLRRKRWHFSLLSKTDPAFSLWLLNVGWNFFRYPYYRYG